MKIVCLGSASFDITYPLDNYPCENTKNRVLEQVQCGGGPASNAAYLLGLWKTDVTFVGTVGNDIYGKRIKKEFESVCVNTKYLYVNPKVATALATIIVNKKKGSRTILTYRPEGLKMPDVNLSFTPDVILIDGQEDELALKFLDKYQNSITIIDAGRPTAKVIALAKKVDYLVCSKEFALKVTGIECSDTFSSLVELYKKMETIFKNTIVITLEEQGSLYKYENKIKLMPSLKVKALDSTGAGDLFHGAFTYAISQQYSLEEAIKLANITGALSVTKIGGRNSAFPLAEVMKLYEHFR